MFAEWQFVICTQHEYLQYLVEKAEEYIDNVQKHFRVQRSRSLTARLLIFHICTPDNLRQVGCSSYFFLYTLYLRPLTDAPSRGVISIANRYRDRES